MHGLQRCYLQLYKYYMHAAEQLVHVPCPLNGSLCALKADLQPLTVGIHTETPHNKSFETYDSLATVCLISCHPLQLQDEVHLSNLTRALVGINRANWYNYVAAETH